MVRPAESGMHLGESLDGVPGGRPVAVIGSPNSTTAFTVDVLEHARKRALDHAWVIFDVAEEYNGRFYRKRALCQLGAITTRNRWHEDPVIRAVIKHQGALPALSGDSDLTSAQLVALGVFLLDEQGRVLRRTTLSTPPPSGTSVYPADAPMLRHLVQGDIGIFYAGQSPGDGLPVPLTLRHFGKTEEGGFGEAYHGAIFGQSRSGKSVLASQIVTGFAANPQLGILIIDPQGEFARDRFAAGDGRVDFSLHRMLRSLKQPRDVRIITTDDVAMEGAEAFTELLRRKGFFDSLGFKGAHKEREASERLANLLGELVDDEGRRRPVRALTERDLPLLVADLARFADVIYATRPGTTPGEGQRAADVQNRFELDRGSLTRRWNETLDHFRTGNGKTLLSDAIQMVLRDREIVILSFAQDNLDATPYFMLNEILTRIRHVLHRSYHQGATSNALILLDEAHLFADESNDENPDRMRSKALLEGFLRMAGKYSCSVWLITQQISTFSATIRKQLHVKFFGQGFRVGGDKEYVETELGKEGFQRYASLPDPKRTGRYSWMVTGPIVSLGSLGTPLVLQAYRSSDDLMRTNGHLFPVAQEPAEAIELPRTRSSPRAPADLAR